MAEILGLGVTHWPTLCLPNEGLTSVFKRTLTAPNVEAARKDPELAAALGIGSGGCQSCFSTGSRGPTSEGGRPRDKSVGATGSTLVNCLPSPPTAMHLNKPVGR